MFDTVNYSTSCKLALTGGASVAGLIKEPNIAALAGIGAITGGTAEALGGGKFANGAVTGAFVALFNHGQNHSKSSKKGKLNVKEFDNREDTDIYILKLQEQNKVEYAAWHFTHKETGKEIYVVDLDSPVDALNCDWRPEVRNNYESQGYDITGLFHTHPSHGIQYGNSVDIKAMNDLGANYQDVVTKGFIYKYESGNIFTRNAQGPIIKNGKKIHIYNPTEIIKR